MVMLGPRFADVPVAHRAIRALQTERAEVHVHARERDRQVRGDRVQDVGDLHRRARLIEVREEQDEPGHDQRRRAQA